MCQNLWPDELKILVVDDEQEILNLIRLSLEPAGFRILRTSKATEGLSLALHEKPDLLILDLMMPAFDGFELLRRVRRQPDLEKVPAIIVSAQASTRDQQRMLWLGQREQDEIDAYIGKPFNPAHLLKTVKQVLTKHKAYLLAKHEQVGRQPWDRNLAA